MASRRIKSDLRSKEGTFLIAQPSIEGSRILLEIGEEGGRFSIEELLNAIYDVSPEHKPDDWKVAPEWAGARVIEAYDNYGARRLLLRPHDGGHWVTDAGTYWSQGDAEQRLTDVRILVDDDES